MGDFLKKEWVKIFVNCILSALIFLLGFWLTSRRADSQDLIKKVDKKADIEYVDKQDNKLNTDIASHKLDDKNKDDIILNYLQSVDRKIDVLLTKK